MTISRHAVTITTGTNAKGTAQTVRPICGHIEEVRIATAGTALLSSAGGTATLTITRGGTANVSDGGTILAVTTVTAPNQWQPRNFVHTVAGVNGTVLSTFGPPVDDYLTFVVTQGGTSTTGTVYVHIEETG